MITIKRHLNTAITTVKPLTTSVMTRAVMGEETIRLVWEVPDYVPLEVGDYIDYEGTRWKLKELPEVAKLSTRLFRYNAVFKSPKYDTADVLYMLFDNTPTLPQGEFSLTGDALMFMELLIANLNRTGTTTWTLGNVPANTEYLSLSFQHENCLSVLDRLASEFDTEYHFAGNIIHLQKMSTEREVTLEYPATLYDIERVSVDNSSLVTRLYPYGSDRNLPANYRGGNMPLCLPESEGQYIESANTTLYGIIEQAKTFDTIYPRLSSGGAGVVTAVGDKFTFTDSNIDFDVNDYLLDGTTALVRFNTGQCAGIEFEIKSYKHAPQTFVIIENDENEGLSLPSDTLKPVPGDKYVLLDIEMPESYRMSAEQELLEEAQLFLSENDTPKVSYRSTFNSIYAKQNLQNIECGDTVRVIDTDLGIDERIRITKLTKGIADYWTLQYDLSHTVTKTTLERIEGDINSIHRDVATSNERINRSAIRSWKNSVELREMVFDPEGYFNPEKIKPLSIETSMLSVGAKSQIFQLTSLLQPNYGANAQVLQWSAGVLAHFTVVEDEIKEWIIVAGSVTITGSNTAKALYIYARCSRSGTTGDIYLDAAPITFDSNETHWYFLLGVLHSPIDGVRGISLSYGQTTIAGQFIRTGVVASNNGGLQIDLDNETITANRLTIRKPGGATEDVGERLDEIDAKRSLRIEKWATPGWETYRENVPYTATLGLWIFEDNENVTAAVNIARFVWSRQSENPEGDLVWNALHAHEGASIYITGEDLVGDTSFVCNFYNEDGTQLIASETF